MHQRSQNLPKSNSLFFFVPLYTTNTDFSTFFCENYVCALHDLTRLRTNQRSHNLPNGFIYSFWGLYTPTTLISQLFSRKLFVFYWQFNKIFKDCERINVHRFVRNQILCSFGSLYTPTTLISQLFFMNTVWCFTGSLTRSYKIANRLTFTDSSEIKFFVLLGPSTHQQQ